MIGLVRRASVCLVLLASASPSDAENWPGWRGPRGDGTSLERQVARHWDGPNGTNVAWRVPIAGKGHSSPIVWGDRVFLTSCLEPQQRRVLICLNLSSGALEWERTVVAAPLEQKHQLNSYASGTPVTDGELVYVSFLQPAGEPEAVSDRPDRLVSPGDLLVAAYDLDGRSRWVARPGGFSSIHGFCSSPILYGDKLIVNGDHDGESYLVALDRATGQTVWKTAREHKTRSYVTPIVRSVDGQDQLVLSGSLCVTGYNPADGSRIWYVDGPTEQFVASPVFNGDLWFITAGFPEFHIVAIRPGGRGRITDTHIAWRTTKGCAYVPSPIVMDRYFLVVSDNGIGSCFEASTGRRCWMERLGSGYSASLVSADGFVYATADDGVTKVIRPAEQLEIVAVNSVGESVSASPAISQGRLLLRGENHLYCIVEPTASHGNESQ